MDYAGRSIVAGSGVEVAALQIFAAMPPDVRKVSDFSEDALSIALGYARLHSFDKRGAQPLELLVALWKAIGLPHIRRYSRKNKSSDAGHDDLGTMRSVPGAVAIGSQHSTPSEIARGDRVATAPGTDIIIVERISQ